MAPAREVAGPLSGRTVVITRPRSQADEMAGLLEREGARVLIVPTIRIMPSALNDELYAAIGMLDDYDYVIFTSANAVSEFLARIGEGGRESAVPDAPELVAIGPATAAALREHGLEPALVPEQHVAEGVLAALEGRGHSLAGAHVLIPRAAEAREVLPDTLRARGASVDVVTVYETVPVDGLAHPPHEISAADYITFTSTSTVDQFVALMGPEGLGERLAAVRLCSIGPITSEALARHGLPVAVEAPRFTTEALVKVIVADARRSRP